MSSVQILILVGFLISFFFIFFTIVKSSKSLNNVKNKEIGDGQYGTDRFATKKEIMETYNHIPFTPSLWRKNIGNDKLKPGIIVGFDKKKNGYTALIDSGDVHALMIGASGIGKTTFFLYPNIEYALACGVSFFSTDTKGDIYKNVAKIAKEKYGYNVSVIDLRNPIHSHGNNFLYLVNKYMDLYKKDTSQIQYKSKAEKYAKIIAKTIIYSGNENSGYGQNAYFYDSAEGLISACILLVSEFCKDEERHIVSVFKIIRELMSNEQIMDEETIISNFLSSLNPNSKKKKKAKLGFKELFELLPEDHKAKWLASAAISSSDQAVSNVLSTALSRLNDFLDTELEQILCQNTNIDAEKFAHEKSCIFIVLPEEDNSKHFLASLLTSQLYRELLLIADEEGGKLKRKILFFLDEFGTIPKIQNADMMFSASRSRNISIIAIIQSYAQLEHNYGDKEAQIISDNTQLTIFGGFAPTSQSATKLSSSLGYHTIQGGSLSGENSLNIQMIQRALKTEGEIKSMDRGKFIIMKTFSHPIETHYYFYTDLGIKYDGIYTYTPSKVTTIKYANKQSLMNSIKAKYKYSFSDTLESRIYNK